MNKAEFKEKRKKLLEQRVRPTEGPEAVPAWDCDFNGSNEVLQSDEVELLENMTPIVPEDRPKTSEMFKEKRNKARHKLDAPILSEQLSDYPDSLNARDTVSPPILVQDGVPDNVQECTLSEPGNPPHPAPVLKKAPKTQYIVGMTSELNKRVSIISYGNALYYHNGYYYAYLDAEHLIRLYREHVDYELNYESSLYGYKDLYECCVTDPKLQRSEAENEPIYAPLQNGIFDLEKQRLYPHSPDRLTFTCIKAKYDPKAKCPVFDSFLFWVTHGNPQLLERFWMALGSLFIYPTRGKFFIFMEGVSNSGKSVLGNFCQRLYPKESVSNIRLRTMKENFGLMRLLGAVINFELDMPNTKLNAEVVSRLKQITGGDSIDVPRKYLSSVTLERQIKFVFASNHPLCLDGEDDAFEKRIVYLPFDRAVPDDQQDPYLGDKIWAERNAIVTKALHYARKLVQLNYIFPKIPQVDSAEYVVQNSSIKSAGQFVQESCERCDPDVVTALEDLYNAYLDFCKEKDVWACSRSAFKEALTMMELEHTRSRCPGNDMIVRKNPVSAFRGIRLRP
ncbi:DNA primase family protein [Anaerotignum sp.]|jgi:putative DNA primase/helicase|uniref:DNA primase family protein n=1 Tax=Anaerotignum sp. TaxID=2039241 RepID=UPI003A86D7B6